MGHSTCASTIAWWCCSRHPVEAKRYKAASALQAGLQTLLVCHRFALAHKAAITAQSWVRSRQARKNYLASVARMVRMQRWWRSIVKRRRWRNANYSTTKVQRTWRGKQGRLQAKVRLFQICRLQRVARLLLTTRRNRIKWQSFRERTLSMYKTCATVPPTPREALQESMLFLGSQYWSKKFEIQVLKKQVARLEELIVEEPQLLEKVLGTRTERAGGKYHCYGTSCAEPHAHDPWNLNLKPL